MIEQHPLTDETIEEIAQFEPDLTGPLRLHRAHDMRAGFDMGRKKGRDELLVWLSKNLKNYTDAPDHWGGGRHIDYLIKDLVLAMCPQETAND